MRITYTGLDGHTYTQDLQEIAVTGMLLHATPDRNVDYIRVEGLKTHMPKTKLMVDIAAIFCTIPSKTPHTSDLFRYYKDWSIVVIDTEAIPKHRWYIDFLSEEDVSNNGANRHVMTFQHIPAHAIRNIIK